MTSTASSLTEDEKVRCGSFTSSGDDSCGLRKGSMNQKDSGIESSDQVDFPVLPNETMAKIVSVVEWYFSDENLSKDSFLLKHISRNREGYVSLKLVSSLRKVKSVTKDWKSVAVSIRKVSKKLLLNDETSKVKRMEPLPVSLKSQEGGWSKCNRSRLMLVSNISFEKFSIGSLSSTVSRYGNIELIRVYRDRESPPNTGHLFNNHNGSNSNSSTSTNNGNKWTISAIVQYESHESVEEAVKCINETSANNWRSSMKAVILVDESTYDVKCRRLTKVPGGGKNKNQSRVQGSQSRVQEGKTEIQMEAKIQSEGRQVRKPFSRLKTNPNDTHNSSIRQPFGPDPSGSKGFKRNVH